MVSGWHVIDLTNKPLGRIASSVAKILSTRPHQVYGKRGCAFKLLLINSEKVLLSKRLLAKRYWRHSGYPGGIKCKLAKAYSASSLFVKVLANMLPNTKIRRELIGNVRMFKAADIGRLCKGVQYLDV
ncbi:uL13 family ribosomal protein [Candidatus Hodgkinia cicadicola]